MDQSPGGLPPRRGLVPTAQPFYPQYFAPPPPPMTSFYDQQYQQGIMMPVMNPDGTGAHYPVWNPGAHHAPNFYPYYQQGFGTSLNSAFHQQNQNPVYPNEYINGYPHGGPETYQNPRKFETQQNFDQPSVPRYLSVPQNTPEFPYVEPVRHGQPQLNSPGPNRRSPSVKSAQTTRHRGNTFPGSSPPNFKHFEGSRKQDWNMYSGWSDSHQSNSRKSSSDGNSPSPEVIELGGSSTIHSENSRVQAYDDFESHQARNSHGMGPHNYQDNFQNEVRASKEFHSQPKKDWKPIPTTFRKPHFAKPSLIAPASTLHWVEIQAGSKDKNLHTHQSDSFIQQQTFEGSGSIVPTDSYPQPLVVTSCPAPLSKGPQSSTLNPKASDFVMVSRSIFPKVSGEEDEYVGYYMTGDDNELTNPIENHAIVSDSEHGSHSMGWNVANDSTVRRIPKEFVENAPGSMNWENGAFNVIRDDRSVRSWGSWNSEDEEEVKARIATTGPPPASKNDSGKLEMVSDGSPINIGNLGGQAGLIIINEQTEGSHTVKDTQNPENSDQAQSSSADLQEALEKSPGRIKTTEFGSSPAETLKPGSTIKSNNAGIVTEIGKIDNPVTHNIEGSSLEGNEGRITSEEISTPFQVVRGEKSKGKKKKPTSTTLQKEKLDSKIEVLHSDSKPIPALPLMTVEPAQTQLMETEPSTTPEEKDDKSKISTLFSTQETLEVPKIAADNNVSRPIFNYRDALLKRVEGMQAPVITPPNIQAQKSEKSPSPNLQTQAIGKETPSALQPQGTGRDCLTKPTIPKSRTQKDEHKVKTGPATEIGLRRKFFLQPIPSTVTYHSLIQHIRGGMLEDIYISGLSPHPSAWKGVRSDDENRGDGTRYGHVSFYSNEGANKFWELVQTGNQQLDSYISPYGGFDDEAPGFFIFEGTKVFVRWRHNDQRLVNPATLRAVEDENATRCLLLRFNARVAAQWNKERKTVPGKLINNEIVFNEDDIIKKVNAEIESWGMADSNIEMVEVIGMENLPESAKVAMDFPDKQKPKDVGVLVSFIKILSAVKLRKYLLSKSEYSRGGYCTVEYYKDSCAESIDELKAVRMAEVAPTKPHKKKKKTRAAKENIAEGGTAEGDKNTAEEKNPKDKCMMKGDITPNDQNGGTTAKENKEIAKKKAVEEDNGRVIGRNKQTKEGPIKPTKTVVIGKVL